MPWRDLARRPGIVITKKKKKIFRLMTMTDAISNNGSLIHLNKINHTRSHE